MIKLSSALKAGYTFFYCPTYEMDRTIENIENEMKENNPNWKTVLWDFTLTENPESVLELLQQTEPLTAVIAKNFNWFLGDEKFYNGIQFIQNNFSEFCTPDGRKALIIVSDQDFNKAVPNSLKKDFIVIDFPLPTKDEIKVILEKTISLFKENKKFKSPDKNKIDDIINAAIGLSKRGIENAFAYSIVETLTIDPKIVASMRSAEINETSGLKVAQYDNIDEVLGYEVAKEFISRAIKNPDSRGCLLLGPPGIGKTMLAKWASTISSKIMIEFDLAGVQGQGLYGQAEAEMKEALRVIKSISNCILFIDEIEKAIPSKTATNDTTGTRSFSQLLKFLSDNRPKGCFVIATCNDISKLPPEWIRSERFDVIFFADLPSESEKSEIYKYYLEKFKVKENGFKTKDMIDWTGAEIKTACRLASVLNCSVKESSEYVVPIAKTMKDDISQLKKWAEGRTIAASKPITKIKRRQIEI